MPISPLRSYTPKVKPSIQPPRRFQQPDAPLWGVASARPPSEAGGGDTALSSVQPAIAPLAVAQAPADLPVDPGASAPGRKLAGTGKPDRPEGTVDGDRLEGRGANDTL